MKAFAFAFQLSSPPNLIIEILCAAILFFTVMIILRLTRVRWIWSILGGTLAIIIYSILNFLAVFLLESFMRGWLFG